MFLERKKRKKKEKKKERQRENRRESQIVGWLIEFFPIAGFTGFRFGKTKLARINSALST